MRVHDFQFLMDGKAQLLSLHFGAVSNRKQVWAAQLSENGGMMIESGLQTVRCSIQQPSPNKLVIAGLQVIIYFDKESALDIGCEKTFWSTAIPR